MITVATTLPKALKPRGEKDLAHKEVGLWIREQGIRRPVIVSNLEKVAFYADGRYVKMLRANFEGQMRHAAEEGADYVVVGTESLRYRCPDFPLEGRAGLLSPVHRQAGDGGSKRDEIIVYRVAKRAEANRDD